MCSHFRPGVLFGAQDRSCPSHVPQRTRYKFVTTNAWVQFEMCFFLAYAVRVSYTQNKKHMYKSRSAQRGLPAKLWGEQHLVHTLYLYTLCIALAVNFARTGPRRKTCECGFNGTLNIVTLDLGSLTWPRGVHCPKVWGAEGGVARKVVWKLKWVTGTLKCSLFYQSYFPLRFVSSSKLKAARVTKKKEGGCR